MVATHLPVLIEQQAMVRQKQMNMATQRIETILQDESAAQFYASAIDKPKLLVREKDIEKAIIILIKKAYLKN